MKVKALILGAGYATRLYPLTENRPKALLDIAGRKMLDYLVDELLTIPELDGIVIVSNHRFAGQFSDWVEARKLPIPCEVLDDGTTGNENRLGAIGDIVFSLRKADLDDDLLVAASDNLFTFRLQDFVDDWRRHGKDTLLVQEMPDVNERRRFAIVQTDETGRVLSVVEKPEHPEGDLAAYALYIYRRDTLPLFEEYLREGNNPDSPGNFPVWLCKKKDVRAYRFEGECVDIGTLESYRDVCRRYEERKKE